MYARIGDYFMNSPKKSLEHSTVNTYKSIIPIQKNHDSPDTRNSERNYKKQMTGGLL